MFPRGNVCDSSGLLTATGAEAVYDTTVTIAFSVNGKQFTKTAITDGTAITTDYNTGATFPTFAASQGSVAVWALTAGGTVKVMMGTIESCVGGTFANAPQFPNIPNDVTPFAYQVLKASSTAGTIALGTSNWNATGFSNAIVNVKILPDRPQIA